MPYGERIKFHVANPWLDGSWNLWIIKEISRPGSPPSIRRMVAKLVWEDVGEIGGMSAPHPGTPTISQPKEEIDDGMGRFVDRLMAALENSGVKPSGAAPNDRETAALKNHLNDLKAIAFKQLGITENQKEP